MVGDTALCAAIEAFHRDAAPNAVRRALKAAGDGPVLPPDFPYRAAMTSKTYRKAYHALQIEAVKMQAWARRSGARVAILFEGRDAAGKGGAIRRFARNLNPRGARIAALPRPSDAEAGQWYFQRYAAHLPGPGEIVLFDRSWYNRGVVEPVFGFCTDAERERFFRQVPGFEAMLVEDGIILVKLWLTISRAEQLRRFLDRARDPLRRWKLSTIDVDGLSRWDAYTDAIAETLARSHTALAPWTVLRADDKRRARLEAMRAALSRIPYAGRDPKAVGAPDPLLAGPPERMLASPPERMIAATGPAAAR